MKYKLVGFLKLLPILFLFVTSAYAQSKHFIYVETQSQQPFFARIKDKVYSSTINGYLVIPQLTEDSYLITLGFPKNILPAHKYDIEIKDRDLSYRIEIKDSVSWDLHDAIGSEIVEVKEVVKTQSSNTIVANDEFKNVLAQVSNTPSVRNISLAAEPDTTTPAQVPVVAVKEKNIASPEVKPSEKPVTQVSQMMSILDSSGRSMIYTVKNGQKFDTVVVFIAYESSLKQTAKSKRKSKKDYPDPPAADNLVINENKIQNQDITAIESKQVEIKQTRPADTVTTLAIIKQTEEVKQKPCETKADDKDFITLRRKMVDENDEPKMVEVAEKTFKSKCFDTEQIKNLCFVILDEDVKLKFLESAFDHVTDKNNFGSLVSILNKPSNISRFNKLIGL